MESKAFSVTRDQLDGPHGSTVLITGGGAGIGLTTAILLHDLGNNVVALDRAPLDPSAPASLTGSPRFLYQQCDVTSWASQRAAFEAGVSKFGGLDAAYVNAGIYEHGDQFFRDDLDADGRLKEPERNTIDIDLRGAIDTVKLALYYMRKKEAAGGKKGGSIVMTSSLAGYLASAGAPLYSAAKHGIVGLMRALKQDTAKFGIAISVVAPGITMTNMTVSSSGQTLEEFAVSSKKTGIPTNDPHEVACAVVWLMGLGMEANGKGLLIQAGRIADVEAGYAKNRKLWMGGELLNLFKGGRGSVVFENKL